MIQVKPDVLSILQNSKNWKSKSDRIIWKTFSKLGSMCMKNSVKEAQNWRKRLFFSNCIKFWMWFPSRNFPPRQIAFTGAIIGKSSFKIELVTVLRIIRSLYPVLFFEFACVSGLTQKNVCLATKLFYPFCTSYTLNCFQKCFYLDSVDPALVLHKNANLLQNL